VKKTELKVGRKPLKERTRLPDDALPYAIKHWIKLQALVILYDGEFTASEIAEMIGEDVKLVSGHIRGLYDSGRIEVADFKTVGNHRMPVYRAIATPYVGGEEYIRMPIEERHDMSSVTLQSFFAEALASHRAGKMDDDEELAVIWDVMNLDAQGNRELTALETAFWEDTRGINATAANRMAESGEEGTSRIVAFLGFKRARQGKPRIMRQLRKK
jgi:hypothetical protein